VRPTLELPGHPGVFAVGDIIHWRECKQAAKGNAHLAVVAANVLSLLAGQPLKKEYKGSIEMIVIPIGKSGGGSYFDVLWGIMLGDWFTRLVKAKDLFKITTSCVKENCATLKLKYGYQGQEVCIPDLYDYRRKRKLQVHITCGSRFKWLVFPSTITLELIKITSPLGRRWTRNGLEFPESVASVCSQWRAVMFSVSIFWAAMLITVDDNPTPQSVIRRYLALSNKRPLNITICRHEIEFDLLRARVSEDPEYRARLADPVEKWRMAAVMDLPDSAPGSLGKTFRSRCTHLELLDDELPDDDYASKLKLVDFRHMSGDVLENLNALLDWPVLEAVVYNDCSIPRPAELFRASRYGAIKCMQTEQDVLNVLRDWDDEDCTRLHFTNSAFTENIINALSEPQPDGNWMCPYLTDLVLSGFCQGFSNCEPAQVAFIRMVKIRHAMHANIESADSEHADFAVSSLQEIKVNIQGIGQEVSTEALEWLDANVPFVTWGDWSGGTQQFSDSASSSEDAEDSSEE
ncbi:predicted protein, partial [Postia placenta Mad-698-R]